MTHAVQHVFETFHRMHARFIKFEFADIRVTLEVERETGRER